MDMVTLVPCLTVLVDLESEAPPEAPLLLPRSDSVQLISDESSKRPCSSGRLLVVQARPGWSAVHLEADSASWSRALVEEAKPSCAILRTGKVRALYPHRWRWSRLAGPGLAGPFVGRTAQGALFGMAGDAFHPAGGVEGAWRSGRALGTRLLEEKA
jgi:predicted NAD/FAD-dependent oxidoreductase